jgi:hypothetical protein
MAFNRKTFEHVLALIGLGIAGGPGGFFLVGTAMEIPLVLGIVAKIAIFLGLATTSLLPLGLGLAFIFIALALTALVVGYFDEIKSFFQARFQNKASVLASEPGESNNKPQNNNNNASSLTFGSISQKVQGESDEPDHTAYESKQKYFTGNSVANSSSSSSQSSSSTAIVDSSKTLLPAPAALSVFLSSSSASTDTVASSSTTTTATISSPQATLVTTNGTSDSAKDPKTSVDPFSSVLKEYIAPYLPSINPFFSGLRSGFKNDENSQKPTAADSTYTSYTSNTNHNTFGYN